MKIKELSKKLNIEEKELSKRLRELDSIYSLNKSGISGTFIIKKNEIRVIREYIEIYNFFNEKEQSLKVMRDHIKKRGLEQEQEWVIRLRETSGTK